MAAACSGWASSRSSTIDGTASDRRDTAGASWSPRGSQLMCQRSCFGRVENRLGEGSSGAAHTDDAKSNTRHTPVIKDRISLHENVWIEFWHTQPGPATTLPQ